MLWVPPCLLECTIPRDVLTKQSHAMRVSRISAHRSRPFISKLTSIFQFVLLDILILYAFVSSGTLSQQFEVMTHNQTFLGPFTGWKSESENLIVHRPIFQAHESINHAEMHQATAYIKPEQEMHELAQFTVETQVEISVERLCS
jgi:hypothetical protein